MPIYEYKCAGCERVFDALVKMCEGDKPQTCPHCGSTEVKKVFSTFGVGDGSRTTSSHACKSG